MDGIIINQFEEYDMDAYKLLHDFNLFEDTFLPPYSADANANTTNNNVRNLIEDHHLSDHVSPYNVETLVEEMTIVDEEIPHLVGHDDEEAANANQPITPPTNCDTGNHDCNAEQQDRSPFNDFDLIDWQCVFDLVNSGTVSQEGEPAEANQALTPFNDCNNNCVNNNLEYLEKFLNEETTQEIIHGTNCKTEPILKRSCGGDGGGDNNVKKWVTRKRYKKGSPEDAQRKEEYKIKNRIAAARSFERKQVKLYILMNIILLKFWKLYFIFFYIAKLFVLSLWIFVI